MYKKTSITGYSVPQNLRQKLYRLHNFDMNYQQRRPIKYKCQTCSHRLITNVIIILHTFSKHFCFLTTKLNNGNIFFFSDVIMTYVYET